MGLGRNTTGFEFGEAVLGGSIDPLVRDPKAVARGGDCSRRINSGRVLRLLLVGGLE